jgi:MoxR-like ATPase
VNIETNTEPSRPTWADQPDSRDGMIYELSDQLRLAVDVAFAIRRPLLLRGEPGTGKSSLAPFLARTRNLRYYEYVVTAQSQASDLLWSFDTVRRLGDAQLQRHGDTLDDFNYVEPGPLWWALAPQSAARRGSPENRVSVRAVIQPFAEINEDRTGGAVVLVDEIDKADPDMPNGLLVPLGSDEFTVTETGTVVRQEAPISGPRPDLLVVITTNEERELPQAFLRRCVVAVLPVPNAPTLTTIARQHLGQYVTSFDKQDTLLIEAVVAELQTARADAKQRGIRPPGTAEFLDALRACWNLGISPESEEWRTLRQLVLLKPHREPS